ncbi:PKD domain-containing protein [Vibrio navarrensis]
MLTKVPTEIWAVLLTAVLTVIGSWFFFRSPPIPIAKCESLEGDAPFTLNCISESRYAANISWEYGDGKSDQDIEDISHEYKEPGIYTLKLKAWGAGSDETTKEVRVNDPTALVRPLELDIRVVTKEDRVVTLTEEPVQYTKDDHPVLLAEHSRQYVHRFKAPSGHKIVDVSFKSISAARASVEKPIVRENGSYAEMRFTLTSGPQVDRYRGWLKGVMIIKLERIEPAQDFLVTKDLLVENYGVYPLPTSFDMSSVRSIEVSDSNSRKVIAAGSFNEVFFPSNENYSLQLKANDGNTSLYVAKKDATQ